MIELEHSPLGGSGAKRFMTCYGSFILQRELIRKKEFENLSTEYSKRGTAAHALGEKCLRTNTEPYEWIGEEFEGYKAGFPDGIGLDAVMIYVNECQRIIDEFNGDDCYAIIEDTIHRPDVHPLLKGTIDFGFVTPFGIWLRDYKDGAGVYVDVFENDQTLYYAFLILLNHSKYNVLNPKMPVNIGIVQPNYHGIFTDIPVWETTVEYVWEWGHKVLLPTMHDLMLRSEATENDFVDGDHCQFCPVMLECPKAQSAFKTFVDAEEGFAAMLSNDTLGILYAQKELARKFIKTLENTIYSRLVGGASIEGVKLVDKKTNRVFKPGAEEAAARKFGRDAIYEPRTFKSPASIEKLSSEGKAFTTEWAYKPEAETKTIAPTSDPRPAIQVKTNAEKFSKFATPIDESQW